MKEDLSLQRLVLETCRGHLRALRTSTAAASSGLSIEVGGGWSRRGGGDGSVQDSPQDEADASRAGKAAVKRCMILAPLLLKEVFRQVRLHTGTSRTRYGCDVIDGIGCVCTYDCVCLYVPNAYTTLSSCLPLPLSLSLTRVDPLTTLDDCTTTTQLTDGNNSGAAKDAAAAPKASSTKGGKGKGKGAAGATLSSGIMEKGGKKKAGRASAPVESLSELALSCLEECVSIAAYSSPRAQTRLSRTAKVLTVSS